MNPLLALIITDIVPNVIEAIKARHAQINPTLPPLTDEEAEALLHAAVVSTVAKDDVWLLAKGLPPF
jgi:hypothetical protein